MTVSIFEYRCRKCGEKFPAPHVVGYGSLIMRSTGPGASALLRALDDPVYSEVDGLLCEMGAYSGKRDNERADILQTVFGAACDRDVDGSEFVVGAKPKCPYCGSRNMASWEPMAGDSDAKTSIPEITHETWARLTEEGKRARLAAKKSAVQKLHLSTE